MTVFKSYFKIVKKFLPVIMMYTVIFTFFAIIASGNTTMSDFTESLPKIAIINNDEEGVLTKVFVEYVNEKSEIVEVEPESEKIRDALFYREIDYIIIIPKGYSKDFLEGNAPQIETMKVPDSYSSTYSEMLFNRFWNVAKVYLEVGMSELEISEIILDDLREEGSVSMLDTNQSELEQMKYFYNFTNYTILAICIFVIGMILTIFNNTNIKKRNTSSPLSYKKLNMQLFLGNACVTFLIWLLYTMIGIIMYGKAMFSINGLLMMLNTFVFCIVALSIGFLIGNLVKNKEAQNGIVNVVALGSSFICGAFVPQEMLGDFVLSIARVFPSYWFITNNGLIAELSVVNGETLKPIFINMGIVLLFAIAYYIITNIVSIYKRKRS